MINFLRVNTTSEDNDGNDDCDGGGGGDGDIGNNINTKYRLSSVYWVSGIVLSTILALIHLIPKDH